THGLLRIFRARGLPWSRRRASEFWFILFSFSPRRETRTGDPQCSGRTQRPQRAWSNRAGFRAFYSVRQDHGIASEIRARAPPVRNQIRERQVSARRRLRASPDGNSCHASQREIDRTAASRHDVSAAPLLTNKSAVPRLWQ